MSIFEDKKHNDPAYVGQKPVRVYMTPADTRDATFGMINHGPEHNMSTRNIPARDQKGD